MPASIGSSLKRTEIMAGRSRIFGFALAAALLCAGGLTVCAFQGGRVLAAGNNAAKSAGTPAAIDWDRQAAARYLDSRETWWQSWDRAKKDHGTICVSCHTQAPYAMARPAL